MATRPEPVAVLTASSAMDDAGLVLSIGDDPQTEAFLAERIHEYNANATGYVDAESFSVIRRDEAGRIVAGLCGYTWGGCCFVSYLWVDAPRRQGGLGRLLLHTAEAHARRRGCALVLVATHSFQAPGFYQRMGYQRQSVVRDHPLGHESGSFAKRLLPGLA